MATIWMKPLKRGRGGSPVAGGISVSVHRAGRKDDGRKALVFAVREDVMTAMRWVVGDKVLVGFDPSSGTFTLRRDASGYALSARSTGTKNAAGKCISATLKMTLPGIVPGDLPATNVAMADCVIEGMDICFSVASPVRIAVAK